MPHCVALRAQAKETVSVMVDGGRHTNGVCGSIVSSDRIMTEDEWTSLASHRRVGLAADPTQKAPFPAEPQYVWRLENPVRFLRPSASPHGP